VEIARARAIEESEAETSALRDDRHLAAAESMRRLQRPGVLVHRRAEGGAKRGGDIGEALGIGAADRHVVTPRGGGDLALQASTGLTRLLGEAGAENDRGFDTGKAATLDLRRHIICGHDQNRQIDGLRQGSHRRIGFQALDFGRAATHRIDFAGKRMTANDLKNPTAQAARVRGGADHRYRLGPQQFLDIRHAPFASHRRPSPRAMMPRRISVVPPWMVSLGATMVAKASWSASE